MRAIQESNNMEEMNPMESPDRNENRASKGVLKDTPIIPEDVFRSSETYKCIKKEMETIQYLMKVRKDVEQELTARVSAKDRLKKKMDEVLNLEKTMQQKLT